MKYSEDELKSIEELAAICTPPGEIAIILGLPEEAFKADIQMSDSPARKVYLKGKLSTKIKIRKQMLMLASVGSPSAIEMTDRALLDMEDDE